MASTFAVCLQIACLLVCVMAKPLVDLDLFVGGKGGYACYRLPNLVQLQTPGHLLAVVQVCVDVGGLGGGLHAEKLGKLSYSERE